MWRLAIAGASAFWIVNFLISLTPIAADYRAALSIRYVPMLFEAALGGLLVGTCVSWILLTFRGRVPGEKSVAKSVFLSLGMLLVVTVLVEVPGKFLDSVHAPWPLFFTATAINALRILALGVVIGHLDNRDRRVS